MFVGSIRYNLDPFGRHSDDELWSAVDIAGLKSKVESLDVSIPSLLFHNLV